MCEVYSGFLMRKPVWHLALSIITIISIYLTILNQIKNLENKKIAYYIKYKFPMKRQVELSKVGTI